MADHIVERADTERGHDRPRLFGDVKEVVNDVLGRALETLAQLGVLGGDTHRARVQVTLAHHDAARGDERRSRKTVFFGTQQCGYDDVAPGAHLTVDLQPYAAAETVENEHLLGLGEPELPWQASMVNGGQRRGTGATVVTGNDHDIGMGLGDPRCDYAHARLGDELHTDACGGVDVLEVEDELRQIFD